MHSLNFHWHIDYVLLKQLDHLTLQTSHSWVLNEYLYYELYKRLYKLLEWDTHYFLYKYILFFSIFTHHLSHSSFSSKLQHLCWLFVCISYQLWKVVSVTYDVFKNYLNGYKSCMWHLQPFISWRFRYDQIIFFCYHRNIWNTFKIFSGHIKIIVYFYKLTKSLKGRI